MHNLEFGALRVHHESADDQQNLRRKVHLARTAAWAGVLRNQTAIEKSAKNVAKRRSLDGRQQLAYLEGTAIVREAVLIRYKDCEEAVAANVHDCWRAFDPKTDDRSRQGLRLLYERIESVDKLRNAVLEDAAHFIAPAHPLDRVTSLVLHIDHAKNKGDVDEVFPVGRLLMRELCILALLPEYAVAATLLWSVTVSHVLKGASADGYGIRAKSCFEDFVQLLHRRLRQHGRLAHGLLSIDWHGMLKHATAVDLCWRPISLFVTPGEEAAEKLAHWAVSTDGGDGGSRSFITKFAKEPVFREVKSVHLETSEVS